MLPAAYTDLAREPGPKMIVEGLRLYGTLEKPGTADNPVIIAWADEVETATGTGYARWASDFYNDDSIPWCGLWMAVVACRANPDRRADRAPPEKYLSAVEWAKFGVAVAKHLAILGDTLVFKRDGGGHVALYVGEDATHFHCLGGNQGDAVSIVRIAKDRCIAVRRPPYLNKPPNARKITRSAAGAPVSKNEA